MQGTRFIRSLGAVSKCMQQAQGRVLNAIKLSSRWPSRDELHITLADAATLQWKMERIQSHAEREFLLYAAEPCLFVSCKLCINPACRNTIGAEDEGFCYLCGSRMAPLPACVSCGRTLVTQDKFCPKCGLKVSTPDAD